MPLYTFKNLDTGEVREYVLSYEEMKELERHPDFQRVMEMPTVNTVNSATFVDGHIPNSRKQALDLEKKIATTTAQMYGARPEERDEYRNEIKDMKSRRKAPTETNKGDKKQ